MRWLAVALAKAGGAVIVKGGVTVSVSSPCQWFAGAPACGCAHGKLVSVK